MLLPEMLGETDPWKFYTDQHADDIHTRAFQPINNTHLSAMPTAEKGTMMAPESIARRTNSPLSGQKSL